MPSANSIVTVHDLRSERRHKPRNQYRLLSELVRAEFEGRRARRHKRLPLARLSTVFALNSGRARP
jgi:hypothetical protein